jgi:hypothetical protein
MPGITVIKTPISVGAGYLYRANLGTTLPDNTVAGGVFSVAFAAAWKPLGITKEGHEFTSEVTTDTIDSAEYFDPIRIVTTGRAAKIAFQMQVITATFLAYAVNANAASVISGSGDTLLSAVRPPSPGSELRCLIGWESEDNTERLFLEQAFQAGALAIPRKKGKDNAVIPVEFHAEVAASGYPWQYFSAGAARG